MGVFQILEEIAVDHRVVEVDIGPKAVFRRVEGQIALVVKGEEPEGQVVKVREVLPKAVGVGGQGGAVVRVAPAQLRLVGLVESLEDQVHGLGLELPLVVELDKDGVGHLVIPLGEKEVAGRLEALQGGQGFLLNGQLVGPLGVLLLAQLRQTAGDFNGLHGGITSVRL